MGHEITHYMNLKYSMKKSLSGYLRVVDIFLILISNLSTHPVHMSKTLKKQF